MAAKTQILVEDYLRMTFDHDREYVHGEVVERGMPIYQHGRIQQRLGAIFDPFSRSRQLYSASEVRMRLQPDLIRIPDVAVFAGEEPAPVPSTPPLVIIEIISPDDRWHDLVEKAREYSAWGVKHVWIIDPDTRSLFTMNGALDKVGAFELPGYGLRISPAELFD